MELGIPLTGDLRNALPPGDLLEVAPGDIPVD